MNHFQRRAALVLMPALLCGLAIPAATQSPASPMALQGASALAPFTADQLAKLLPPSVYFAGQTATVQTRNAGGTRFHDGAVVWAALVDTGGYASEMTQRYQFYLVTEAEIQFGGKRLPAGAYGGGFVGDGRFVLMDIGGHTLVEGETMSEPALKRPRPLEVVAESGDSVRLYLGRRFVSLRR